MTHIGHFLYGAAGDPSGGMAFFRELVDHHHNPFLPGTIGQLAAPEGQAIPWPRDLASAPEIITLYSLTALFGATPAFNIYLLAGYTLTGAATFLLARRLTANTWVSLIAGWAFAFYPFAALNGQSHLDNIQGWVLVIVFWRLLELAWRPTRRNGLLAGVAVVFGMWWSPYFILFIGVTYIVVSGALVLGAARNRNLRAIALPHLAAALPVLLFGVFLGTLSTIGATENIGIRNDNVQEISDLSARWFEYLIPDDRSPIFGGLTRPLLNSMRHSVATQENTLYVGIAIVLLASVALVALARHRLSHRTARATLMLFIISAAAVITSMPPRIVILGTSLPMPSHFIANVTASWRAYARFVIVVMLASTMLAAIGLDSLTRRRKPHVRVTMMIIATIAIPLDLWWTPPSPSVYEISVPQLYKTLSHEPPGLLAEYPLVAIEGTYHDTFYQNVYNKPMINGYFESSPQESRARLVSNLANPHTASDLATLGVRYVLFDSEDYGAPWQSPGVPGKGFRLIAAEPAGRFYVVTAKPKGLALVVPSEGFGLLNSAVSETNAWLERASGRIELAGPCESCRGVLSMVLISYGVPRQITLSDDSGRVVLRTHATRSPSQISIPLSFRKYTTLTITSTPGPKPFGKGPNVTSVEVSHLEFLGARSATRRSRNGG